MNESDEFPYDPDEFIDSFFRADLLIEMSPPKKSSVDAALGKVMASSFASGGLLMAAMVHDSHLSGPVVLVIGPVGTLAIGLGSGTLFLRLRKSLLGKP